MLLTSSFESPVEYIVPLARVTFATYCPFGASDRDLRARELFQPYQPSRFDSKEGFVTRFPAGSVTASDCDSVSSPSGGAVPHAADMPNPRARSQASRCDGEEQKRMERVRVMRSSWVRVGESVAPRTEHQTCLVSRHAFRRIRYAHP